jgi:ferredoxin-NADP reductase
MNSMRLRVHARQAEALNVVSLELRPAEGEMLPEHTAGAHVDVHLTDGGLTRQYSLCNLPGERHRYVIGVALAPNSRGGSASIHAKLRAGDVVEVSPPRNHFPLVEDAAHSVLIAGGIGVTPILAMALRLQALKRPFTVHYCVRNPVRAAFAEELIAAAPGGQCQFIFDGLPGVAPLDMDSLVRRAAPDTHFYCCGPLGMLDGFNRASSSLPPGFAHSERFQAPTLPAAPTGGEFVLRLARQGRELRVLPHQSVLDVLEQAGIAVPSSCRDGICGTCETLVLDGEPDHRDCVLSDGERLRGDRMLVCVSRCKGDTLTLDL